MTNLTYTDICIQVGILLMEVQDMDDDILVDEVRDFVDEMDDDILQIVDEHIDGSGLEYSDRSKLISYYILNFCEHFMEE